MVAGLTALLQTPRFHPLKLMAENVSVIGVNLTTLQSRGALLRSEMAEIFRMYGAGQIKPVIGKIVSARPTPPRLIRYIHDRKNIGKVILLVR